MKWTIVTYPEIRLSVGGDGNTVTFDDGGHGTAVNYDATTTNWIGFSSTDHGNTNADVTGVASIGSGGVTVQFSP